MYKLTPQKPIYKAHYALGRAERYAIIAFLMLSPYLLYIALRIVAGFFN